MNVILSCIGKFHHFDLARQLHARGDLGRIYTGYPFWKLKDERIPLDKIGSFPLFQSAYMLMSRSSRISDRTLDVARFISWNAHDLYVAGVLAPCDVFIGLSGHNKRAGHRAKSLGAKWICDRGSSHILFQDKILREEHDKWGVPFRGVPSWARESEVQEYSQCDLITVPSTFAENTFIEAGIPRAKIRRISYGVDLSKFFPVASPEPDRFDMIFVGGVNIRKGIPYLLQAYARFRHPKKSLRIIGHVDPAFLPWVRANGLEGVSFLGPKPQSELKDYMSRSHLFILPSIEEGLALVQAQALACGCPVLCSENTGGADLITHGKEGLIVKARDVAALVDAMSHVASSPLVQSEMRKCALEIVDGTGGWATYGLNYAKVITELLNPN